MQSKIKFVYQANGNIELIQTNDNKAYQGSVATTEFSLYKGEGVDWLPTDLAFICFTRADGTPSAPLKMTSQVDGSFKYVSNGWLEDVDLGGQETGDYNVSFILRRYSPLDNKTVISTKTTEQITLQLFASAGWQPQEISQDVVDALMAEVASLTGLSVGTVTAEKTQEAGASAEVVRDTETNAYKINFDFDLPQGDDGQDGQDGVGIESTVVEYNATNSTDTIPPTDGWVSYIPSTGSVLWTRTTFVFTNGNTAVAYSQSRTPGVKPTNQQQVVYGTDEGGNQVVIDYKKEAVANTIAFRGLGGQIEVEADGESSKQAVNIEYANQHYLDAETTPQDIGAEPAFEKNTAFNKNFGTTAGTAVEGNDVRFTDLAVGIAEANEKAQEAKDIAQGKSQTIVVATYEDLVTLLKNAPQGEYIVGTNAYIKQLDIPDYWVSEVYDNNSGVTGYYGISPLETNKVDLTPYLLKTDAQTTYLSKTDAETTYQQQNDNALETTAKRIVEAINEVNGEIVAMPTKGAVDITTEPVVGTSLQVSDLNKKISLGLYQYGFLARYNNRIWLVIGRATSVSTNGTSATINPTVVIDLTQETVLGEVSLSTAPVVGNTFVSNNLGGKAGDKAIAIDTVNLVDKYLLFLTCLGESATTQDYMSYRIDGFVQLGGGGVAPTTTGEQIYATDADGNQTTLPYAVGAVNDAIVKRDEGGHINVPTSGASGGQALSKEQADSEFIQNSSVLKPGIAYINYANLYLYNNSNSGQYVILKNPLGGTLDFEINEGAFVAKDSSIGPIVKYSGAGAFFYPQRSSYSTRLKVGSITANNVVTLPSNTGTLALLDDVIPSHDTANVQSMIRFEIDEPNREFPPITVQGFYEKDTNATELSNENAFRVEDVSRNYQKNIKIGDFTSEVGVPVDIKLPDKSGTLALLSDITGGGGGSTEERFWWIGGTDTGKITLPQAGLYKFLVTIDDMPFSFVAYISTESDNYKNQGLIWESAATGKTYIAYQNMTGENALEVDVLNDSMENVTDTIRAYFIMS